MSRFDRDFELSILDVVVKPPLRVVFNATKSVTGGLNKMNLQVYNLKESNRLRIVKDAEEQKRIPIELKVGYKGSLQTIFKGTVHKGSNDRKGADFISSFECLDGGFDYLASFTSKTVRGKDKAIDAILLDMPNTTKGKLTEQVALIRPKVLVGNSIKLIEEALGEDESYYIDNEQLFIVKAGEVVSSFIPVATASTGLLNTPQRKAQEVSFEILMNPSIIIGGLVDLRSENAPHLNDVYKVRDITFDGDFDGQNWSQLVTCFSAGNYKVL